VKPAPIAPDTRTAVRTGPAAGRTQPGRNTPPTALQQQFNMVMQRAGAHSAQRASGTAEPLPTDGAFTDHPIAALMGMLVPTHHQPEPAPSRQWPEPPAPLQWPVGMGLPVTSPSQALPMQDSNDPTRRQQARPGPAAHATELRSPAELPSLFDRLVKLIDLSPSHSNRTWRLSIRLHDAVLAGTLLCIESLPGRTELRFTPGSPQAARELAAAAAGWSQRLTVRAGRPVAVHVQAEAAPPLNLVHAPPPTGVAP